LCEKDITAQLFSARIYEPVARKKVVAIAEQLLKVFINPFCNAITLLSQTLAKTENFG